MQLLGIDWVGVNADNGRKVLLSVSFVTVVLVTSWLLSHLAGLVTGRGRGRRCKSGSGPGKASACLPR